MNIQLILQENLPTFHDKILSQKLKQMVDNAHQPVVRRFVIIPSYCPVQAVHFIFFLV